MNKTTKILALVLAIVMICSALAACGSNGQITTTEQPSDETTEATTKAPTDSPSEKPSENVTEDKTEDNTEDKTDANTEDKTDTNTEGTTEKIPDEIVVEGPHAELIQTTNGLANGVQGSYSDKLWREFDISNQNMTLRYNLPHDREQKVAYIKNTQGKSYIENTMDVFVRMTDGYTVYASSSSDDTLVNIYRFGYYYNDFRMQEQNFLDDLEVISEIPVDITKQSYLENISRPTTNDDGSITFSIKAPYDPFIIFSENLNIDTDQYKYVRVTMKTTDVQKCTIYYIAGDQTKFNSSQYIGFNLIPDGEYHTYYIRLFDKNSNAGVFKGIRIDMDEFGEIKKDISISDISLVEAERNGIPEIELENVFHTYSDKLHHEIHIATYKEVKNIAEIGVETIIVADTVSKIIVKDKNGTHDTLDGIDWASVECVGFDITDAGVFGYILPVHEGTGTIKVTLEDGNYVIIYSRAPENNTLVAVDGTPESKAGEAYGNSKDFRMGQRIYTDESHSFDALLAQTEIERNPLGGKNIKVSTAYSANASFLGYDAIRGCYRFWVGYNKNTLDYPNRYFNLNFTVKSDDQERLIYVMAENDNGGSPYVALLDENLLALPVPIEIGNNFVGDKDDTLFDVLDAKYQEALVPIIASTEEATTYNLISAYYCWGIAEMKQMSSIQYHAPYYRLVTGGTETNCLVPWKYTRTPAVPNRLPDHRAISAPEWPGTIDHTQGGSHSFNDAVELKQQIIHSYGPSYSDLETINKNEKYTITYHHIEMPQRDENRAYYTIDYTFNDTTSFADFKNTFSFYSVGSFEVNDYQQFGYLDANNKSQVRKFADLPSELNIFPLGDKPYIDAFKLDSLNYCNVACLVSDCEVIIGGEEQDIALALRANKKNASIALTFDLDKLTFNAGDTISLNIILIPWGSEESDYSGTTYAPDQNIRDVREDSLVNPVVLKPGENCELVEHDWIPMGKTTNGKNAEFTISGGKVSEYKIPNRDTGYRADKGHNMAVRIYGFEKLGVPVIEQLVDGEWVAYDIASAKALDKGGHGAHFDGYGVYLDEDGTYSYTFIVNMDDAKDKTFRISLLEDFEKFPWIIVDDSTLVTESPFHVYYDAAKFAGTAAKQWFSRVSSAEENGVSFVSLFAHPTFGESQMARVLQNNSEVTGQYVVIKYRIPEAYPNQDVTLEFFTSTKNEQATGTDAFTFTKEIAPADGKWHVLVVDTSKFGKSTIAPKADGTYTLKYVRLDPINGTTDTNYRIDIAYFAIHSDLNEILEFNKSEGEDEIIFVTGRGATTMNTADGSTNTPEKPENTDPFLVYHDAEKFASLVVSGWVDHVEMGSEGNVSYASLFASATQGEAQLSKMLQSNTDETGQYIVIKYRIPKMYQNQEVTLEFFTSTVNEGAKGGDNFTFTKNTVPADNQWHVVVVDVTQFGKRDSIVATEDGKYILKHVRFDAINGTTDTSYRIDISYFGIHNNLDEVLAHCASTGDSEVIFLTRKGAETISTAK